MSTTVRERGMYLRVHKPNSAPNSGTPVLDYQQEFWSAFALATGWSLGEPARPSGELSLIQNVSDGMLDPFESLTEYAVGREAATKLALAGNALLQKLSRAEATIRRQEAELAARATPRMSARRAANLAASLQSILKEGVTAARCSASGLYMLDDQTANLKLRARYGIPLDRLQADPRPLRGAIADLEAIVSGIAVMERLTDTPQWSSPEPWEAGMCAAVMVDDMPMGTLWMWRSRAGRFGKAARAAIRLTADRIGLLLQQTLTKKAIGAARTMQAAVRDGQRWQQESLPTSVALAPDWHASGWVAKSKSLSSSWYTWDVLPDGTIALAVGQGLNAGSTADALTAAILRGAWQSHAGYRHSPAQVMRRVADTLWQSSNEPLNGSLVYAKINPDNGEADLAWAGNLPVFIASNFGYRPVCEPTGLFGSTPDLNPATTHVRLEPGDCLTIATPTLMPGNGRKAAGQLSQHELLGLVSEHLAAGPKEILSAIRRATATPSTTVNERGLILVQRLASVKPKAKSPKPTKPPRRTKKKE